MELNKEDHYIKVFMGTTYDIGKPKTIGELKGILEKIVEDLPEDDNLKISEVDLRDGKIDYTLEEGINQ